MLVYRINLSLQPFLYVFKLIKWTIKLIAWAIIQTSLLPVDANDVTNEYDGMKSPEALRIYDESNDVYKYVVLIDFVDYRLCIVNGTTVYNQQRWREEQNVE